MFLKQKRTVCKHQLIHKKQKTKIIIKTQTWIKNLKTKQKIQKKMKNNTVFSCHAFLHKHTLKTKKYTQKKTNKKHENVYLF